MKEWTKRDRTERDKKVPRKNRTLTDWPSLSLRVTAPPPIYSRPTRSSEGNVGQYVRTFVRAFCHSGALWYCGSRGVKSGKPKHRKGMNLPFAISAGIDEIKILDRPLFPNRAYDSDALGSNCFKCKADYSKSDRAKMFILTHFVYIRIKVYKTDLSIPGQLIEITNS